MPLFDRFHEALRFYERQLDTNLGMVRRKGLLFRGLIRRNEFDLPVVGINLHDVAHMRWPFREDRGDPRDPEGRLARLHSHVYEEAEGEIGETQKLLPAESTEVLLGISMYGIN
jgi:hypothetical protein